MEIRKNGRVGCSQMIERLKQYRGGIAGLFLVAAYQTTGRFELIVTTGIALLLIEVVGYLPADANNRVNRLLLNSSGKQKHPETGEFVFGPDNGSNQWVFGANRLTEMACKASDELSYEIVDGGFRVKNHKYSEVNTQEQLWQALWVLERDIRVNHGDKRKRVDYGTQKRLVQREND